MSGNLATTFEQSEVEIISEQRVYHSIALSGRRLARLGEFHRWRLRVRFNPMRRDEIGAIMGFLVGQRGKYETFTFTPAGFGTPVGNWNTTVTVSSVTNDNEIVMAGLATSDSDAVKSGDVFTLAGDTKVYMVTANAASDGSGLATVNFEPSLRITPSGGTAVTHTGVLFTVELDQDNVSFTRGGFLYRPFSIDLVEALG